MNMTKKMKGFSVLSLICYLAFIGIIGIYAFQIAMGYLDQQTIRGAVKSTLIDAKSNSAMTSKDIKNSILKKISISTIDLHSEDISVDKDGKGFDVSVNFEKKIKMTEKINIVMDLDVDETTKF